MSNRPIQISPSILAADFARLGEQVREAEAAGADSIHVDPMDGHFVPNLTFGEVVIDALRASTRLPLNLHLMVEEPDGLLPGFVKAKTDQVIIHAESCRHLHRTVFRVKEMGNPVGVALNPATPLAAVEELLPFLDIALVMTVNPGFGGQSFISHALGKARRLRRLIDENRYPALIEIDGGIKADWTAQDAIRAGADILVAGTAIFNKQESVAQAMRRLRESVAEAQMERA